MKELLLFFVGVAFLCRVHAQEQILASRVDVKSPMMIETMDSCLKVIRQCPFFEDGIPSQVLIEYDYRRKLYRCKICTQDDWRKRSIPTHLERFNPPTFESEIGLKTA